MQRLNKYLAHAGVGSRRHCDDLIFHGRVRVDGEKVREPGIRVDPTSQEVSVDGTPIRAESLVYWLLNKPRGYLCTNHDPAGRPRAVDLLPHVTQRVYTVGRLDEDSEGLLLMTNDGDLAHKLMHPRFGIAKTYLVQVAGKPSRQDLEQLLEGVWLSEGHVKAKRVKRLRSQGESTWLEIVLCEGKNREIRRMLAKLEHKVMRLKRIAIGPLKLDRLKKGKSRKLTPEEVTLLQRACRPRPRSEGPRPLEEAPKPVSRDPLGRTKAPRTVPPGRRAVPRGARKGSPEVSAKPRVPRRSPRP